MLTIITIGVAQNKNALMENKVPWKSLTSGAAIDIMVDRPNIKNTGIAGIVKTAQTMFMVLLAAFEVAALSLSLGASSFLITQTTGAIIKSIANIGTINVAGAIYIIIYLHFS